MTTRASRALWLIAFALYLAAAAGDAALHLRDVRTADAPRFAPSHLVVAFTACLFWPLDLAARVLLPEA